MVLHNNNNNNHHTCTPFVNTLFDRNFIPLFLCVSDLNIVAHGAGDVHIQRMECDVCKVQTERGSCTLQSVKVTLNLPQTHNHCNLKQ